MIRKVFQGKAYKGFFCVCITKDPNIYMTLMAMNSPFSG